MEFNNITIASGMKMRAAMALAVLADILQMALFPLFVEGAISPADDVLDLAMAGILSYLLGWHWEFAPSFIGKLVPGVDFVPLWSLAVANVWRKSKHIEATDTPARSAPIIEGEPLRKK